MAQETATARGYEPDPGLVTISITPQGTIVVDQYTITLSVSKGHKATWQKEGGGDFEIEFKNATPFDHFRFNQSNAKAVSPRQNVPYGPYKYTVKVPGYPELDPQVIVNN